MAVKWANGEQSVSKPKHVPFGNDTRGVQIEEKPIHAHTQNKQYLTFD